MAVFRSVTASPEAPAAEGLPTEGLPEEDGPAADAVSGLDGKMKSAADEYFNMLNDAWTAGMKTHAFFTDYLEFYNGVV